MSKYASIPGLPNKSPDTIRFGAFAGCFYSVRLIHVWTDELLLWSLPAQSTDSLQCQHTDHETLFALLKRSHLEHSFNVINYLKNAKHFRLNDSWKRDFTSSSDQFKLSFSFIFSPLCACITKLWCKPFCVTFLKKYSCFIFFIHLFFGKFNYVLTTSWKVWGR